MDPLRDDLQDDELEEGYVPGDTDTTGTGDDMSDTTEERPADFGERIGDTDESSDITADTAADPDISVEEDEEMTEGGEDMSEPTTSESDRGVF